MGSFYLARQQSLADKLLKLEIKSKTSYERCQSRGRKFNLLRVKGTNQTGEMSYGFCADCFQNGEFTDKELTKNILLDRIFKQKKIKSFLWKWLLKIKINNLERWDEQEYF